MKIAFLSSFRETSVGGENRVAVELAQALTGRGHQVVLICPGDETHLHPPNADGLRRFTMQSAGEREVTAANLSRANVRKLYAFLDDFQPDIVHTHTYLLLGIAGQVWALRNRVPFIYTAHELPTRLGDFSEGYGLAKYVKRSAPFVALVRNFCNQCSAVIALNASALDDIQRLGYQGRVYRIHNGRNLRLFNALPTPEPPAETAPIELMFTGHIMPRKHQDYLVRVMRYLPERYRLTLVGYNGHPAYHEQIEQYIAEHGLHTVRFTGRVEPQDIPALLAQAHVFVSASLLEVQSLAVIEALASGTPVVGLSNETIDELVHAGVGRQLPKDTAPQDFAHAVRTVAEAPDYAQMTAAARETVQIYDWDVVIEKTEAAYADCINQRPELRPTRMTQVYATGTSIASAVMYDGWRLMRATDRRWQGDQAARG